MDFGYLSGKRSPNGFLFIYKKNRKTFGDDLAMIQRDKYLQTAISLPTDDNRHCPELFLPGFCPISFSSRKMGTKTDPKNKQKKSTRAKTEALLLNIWSFHTCNCSYTIFKNFQNGILIWRGLLLLSVAVVIVLNAICLRSFWDFKIKICVDRCTVGAHIF